MYSRVAFGFACICLLIASCIYPKWKLGHTEATISWDVSGYYLYLPAMFIYNDLDQLDFFPEVLDKYGPTTSYYQAFDHESGAKVMKYSAGMAVAYSPFFFLGHAYAAVTDYPADGFSKPYQAAISWGSLLIAFLGLWLARSNLLHFFNDRTTAIVLLLLGLGTNYLAYAGVSNAMTHNYLFTLYALLIFLTIKWHNRPSVSISIWIGLCLGLMALIRPTEIIACAIPIVWGFQFSSFKEHLNKLLNNWKYLLIAALGCALVGSIQFLYWKGVTGDWIVYSYQEQGFSWRHPHVRDVLYSYRKGWLVYTPMMLFALIGFLPLLLKKRNIFWAIAGTFFLSFYITSAWDIWWYGGSFGQRALVQSYALLVFPLAAFIGWVSKNRILFIFFGVIASLFIAQNILQTYQAHNQILEADNMNKAYFWKIFGKTKINPADKLLLDSNEFFSGESTNLEVVYENDFETPPPDSSYIQKYAAFSGVKQLFVEPGQEFSEVVEVEKTTIPINNQWINLSGQFFTTANVYDIWQMPTFVAHFINDNGENIKYSEIRPHRVLLSNQWTKVGFDIELPESDYSKIRIYLFSPSKTQLLLFDDLVIEAFNEK